LTRRLDWAGALNVRDLGGVPLPGGRETRFGELVRADNIRLMGDDGWRALADHGVTRIVDLRWPEELAMDAPRDVDIDVVNVPLFGQLDPDFDDPIDEYVPANDAAGYFGWMYERAWEEHRAEIGRALAAIADAPPGVTLFHCFAGKDRTGLVAALLLRLAGASIDDVAADYALSEANLDADRSWIDSAPTDADRLRRALRVQSPAEAMTRALQMLGDVEAYVRSTGLDDAQVARLRQRLVPA
jgi:protein-tyrosine phosphatase